MGSFGISEGNITGRGKKKKPQNMQLTATASIQIAQALASATGEQGLDGEAWTA